MSERYNDEGRGFGPLIFGGVSALLFLFFAWDSYYTIDQGERGVILHYGSVAGLSEPGLHFKMPFVTSIEKISVRTQKDAFENLGKDDDHRMQAYTADQQPTHVSVAITYHVTDPVGVYSTYTDIGTMEGKLIDPRAYQQVKNVMGQFDAISAIQKRTALDAQVSKMIRANINGPIAIDSVQIQDIEFSPEYEQAVEQRMQAIVAQEKAIAEKARRITNADAAAYEVKIGADANAHQITVQGNAEAGAIRARAEALKENAEMPTLVAAEKWDGHLPSTMPPNGTVPFLSLGH